MFLEAGGGLRLPCFEDRPGGDSMDTVGWAQTCLRDGPNSLEGLIGELVWGREEPKVHCLRGWTFGGERTRRRKRGGEHFHRPQGGQGCSSRSSVTIAIVLPLENGEGAGSPEPCTTSYLYGPPPLSASGLLLPATGPCICCNCGSTILP